MPPGGLAGETDLRLAHAIHLNELEQLPPNVHLSGGVGMLFRSGLGLGLGLGYGLGLGLGLGLGIRLGLGLGLATKLVPRVE